MPYKSALNRRFKSSITQVDELLAIHTYLRSVQATPITDNILRAALTMLVSAVDTFIHELVINAVLFELNESKSAFEIKKINIPLEIVKETDETKKQIAIAANLRRQYNKETFQSSRQIETALSSIGLTKLWKSISPVMGDTSENIKLKIDLLVHRRNQIVHEGDLDHLHTPREIYRTDIDAARNFCIAFVDSTFKYYETRIMM